MGFNILMGIDHYPPILGGSQLQTQLLCRELVKRGHTVTVITTWQSGLLYIENDFGVTIYRIKGLTTRVPWFFKDLSKRRPPPFPDPGMVQQINQLINAIQPDLVQACGWIVCSLAAALRGKQIPFIVTVRNYFHSCATGILMNNGQICDGPGFNKCISCASQFFGRSKALAAVAGVTFSRELIIHQATVFHCISVFIEKILQRDLLNNKEKNQYSQNEHLNCVLIPDLYTDSEDNSVDLTFLSKLPSEPFMLFVGALSPHKGIKVLLDAYNRLVSPPPLVLIGTVEHNTPKLFPPEIIVLKDVPHSLVMKVWERCLFGLVPSLWPDSFPNVVLEGMSKSKAIIGSDVGGIPDMIVDGQTGFLVPMNDSESLANAMQELIGNKTLRDKFGVAGKLRINNEYSPHAILPQFESLYQKIAIEKNYNFRAQLEGTLD